MNILVLSPFWPQAAAPTSGIFVQQQARALRRAGHSIVVISPQPHWLPIPGKSYSRWRRKTFSYQNGEGIKIYFPRFWRFPKNIGWSLMGRSCYRAVKDLLVSLEARNMFDVVHAHGIEPVGLLLPYLKRDFSFPIVMTIHGKSAYLNSRSHRDDPSLQSIMESMWESVDACLPVGRPLLSHLRALGCPDGITQVVSNGAEIPFDNISRVARQYRECFAEEHLLLSVSNLIPTKGVDDNIKALRLLLDEGVNNWHYAVVGEGRYRNALEKLVADLNLSARVSFLGSLPHAETMAYMAACDIFTLPSWREAFGVVYLEAMASGKPVIGCFGQGAEETIQNQENGLLVPPRNPERLAEALHRLVSHPRRRRILGEAGRQTAQQFTWARNAERCLQIYDAVVASSSKIHK